MIFSKFKIQAQIAFTERQTYIEVIRGKDKYFTFKINLIWLLDVVKPGAERTQFFQPRVKFLFKVNKA